MKTIGITVVTFCSIAIETFDAAKITSGEFATNSDCRPADQFRVPGGKPIVNRNISPFSPAEIGQTFSEGC